MAMLAAKELYENERTKDAFCASLEVSVFNFRVPRVARLVSYDV